MEMFPDVFDEGLGLLEGEYHIRLNDSANPVQHAPQRGQVALRSKIKDTLEELHSAGVIELDLVYVSTPEEDWKHKNLSRPKGSQQSYSLGELSYAYHRGHCNSPSWRQSVLRPRRKEWFLACQVGRGVIASDYFSHAFWPLSLV